MRANLRTLWFAVLLPLFASCASHKFDLQAFEKAWEEGNYATCISMLCEKGVYDKNSLPLKNMDIATLYHYMGDYKNSATHFKECGDLMEMGDLQSVSQFESFYLNILNSLNYHNQGQLEGALVEIKNADHVKVNKGKSESNALWYIYSDNEEDLLSIRSFDEDDEESDEYKKKMSTFGIPEAQVSAGTPRKPTVNDLYRSSPTAYYLGNLFRNAAGDEEGARLDKDILKTLNPNFKIATRDDGKALLNVIAFSGGIARKEEVVYYYPPEENGRPVYMKGVTVPDEKGTPMTVTGLRYKFAYQKAGENNTKVDNVIAIAQNVETAEEVEARCDFLEDFGNELKKNVALKARKEFNKNKVKSIIGKTGIALVSIVAVVTAEVVAQKTTNPLLKAIANAAFLAAVASYKAILEKFDKSIKTDLRQARFLAARSYAGALNLAEGTYNIKVQYKHGNTLIKEEEYPDVAVSASRLNLLESICLK